MARVYFIKFITRDMVQSQPNSRFVFGDNLRRIGYGGQAGAMRGEPNAIGVATKRAPGMAEGDFFSDDFPPDWHAVNDDIDIVIDAFRSGRDIYLPADGLGTGLSQLPTRAPALHQHIINRFRALVEDGADYPWGN